MTTPLPIEARNTFFAHFPQSKRGTIANWFLEPIREQRATTPRAVITCVTAMLRRRLGNAWCSGQAREDATFTLEICTAHDDEALACAAYYLAYAQLPEAEREAIKERERGERKNEWMAKNPPSDRQVAYLRSLGYVGEPPASMRDASEAIDRLLGARGKAVRR